MYAIRSYYAMQLPLTRQPVASQWDVNLHMLRLLLAWGLILYGLAGSAMALAPTFAWRNNFV